MKRQIKKLSTFNRRLQKLARDIDAETRRLTKIQKIEIDSNETDNIELFWDDLDILCGDMTRYISCNGI